MQSWATSFRLVIMQSTLQSTLTSHVWPRVIVRFISAPYIFILFTLKLYSLVDILSSNPWQCEAVTVVYYGDVFFGILMN